MKIKSYCRNIDGKEVVFEEDMFTVFERFAPESNITSKRLREMFEKIVKLFVEKGLLSEEELFDLIVDHPPRMFGDDLELLVVERFEFVNEVGE